jgi:predicted ribosomally synthesized peptide with SipW-like signal peptide
MDAALETTDAGASVQHKRRRSRMIRAILAGGLVLGVGAAVTLAAWNDSEAVYGDFGTGTFDLQGSLNGGGAWANHDGTTTASKLSFQLPATATALSPGDTVYAPFALRLAANTTNSANISVAAVQTGTSTGLTLTVYNTGASTTCDATVTTGAIANFGGALNATPAGTIFTLAPGAPTTVAGAAVNLCFKVAATSTQASLPQGQVTKVTWTFTAASI